MPDERKSRYINSFSLSEYDASILTSEKEISNYFDDVLSSDEQLKKSSKIVVNWITSELFSLLKKKNIEINNSPVTPENLGKLIKLILSGKISGKLAKDVFEFMFESRKSPETIVIEKGLTQVSDINEIYSNLEENEYNTKQQKIIEAYIS